MPYDLQEWNNRIVAEFRSNAGFVPWSTAEDLADGRPIPPPLPGFDPDRGVPIILVNHTGAATRRRRTNPLMYQPVSDAFAIFGGSRRPPAWYRNIEKNPDVTIEVGADVAPATARVTHGTERERIWSEQVRLMPPSPTSKRLPADRSRSSSSTRPETRPLWIHGGSHDAIGHEQPQ